MKEMQRHSLCTLLTSSALPRKPPTAICLTPSAARSALVALWTECGHSHKLHQGRSPGPLEVL